MNISDVKILLSISVLAILLISYSVGFQRGYSTREKERIEYDERQRIKRRILSKGRGI